MLHWSAEMKGVWQVDGLEVPQAQATAQEESAVPDCANNGELPSYVGLDYDAPRVRSIQHAIILCPHEFDSRALSYALHGTNGP